MHIYGLSNGEIALRLLIAALLGGLVGWDRERKEGVAGLRTHMLVCIGSALVMIVSTFGFQDVLDRPDITLDPSRVAAQVVSGIGFLGAGTILFLRPQIVRGLTTAAGLWSVAAVGLAVGGGLYAAAVIATVIIFVVLALIKPIEGTFLRSTRRRSVTLLFDPGKIGLAQIESVISKHRLATTEILVHSSNKETSDQLKITFHHKSSAPEILLAIDELKALGGINEITSRI